MKVQHEYNSHTQKAREIFVSKVTENEYFLPQSPLKVKVLSLTECVERDNTG